MRPLRSIEADGLAATLSCLLAVAALAVGLDPMAGPVLFPALALPALAAAAVLRPAGPAFKWGRQSGASAVVLASAAMDAVALATLPPAGEGAGPAALVLFWLLPLQLGFAVAVGFASGGAAWSRWRT